MIVELIHAPGCERCTAEREALKAAALQAVAGVEWRERDVLEDLDYAVECGVLSTPAIIVDGELVFSALPTPQQLYAALIRRAAARA